MTMLAGGKWIDCGERNPEQYGKYRVLCLKRGQRTEDDYLWNGAYWVTPAGSPSKGVQAWWEQPAAEEKRALTAGMAGKALTLVDYEARIQLYKEQAVTGYIGIGRTLNEAKAAGVVPHGEWEAWVERTTGLAIRQAQRCMQAASEIREGSFLGQIDMSKAMLLLSSGLDSEQKEALAERAVKDDSSVRELKEQIRQLKLEKVQAAGATTEIRQALKQAESERDQLKDQMNAAVDAVREDAELRAQRAYEQGAKDQAETNTAALAKANRALDKYEQEKLDLLKQLKELQDANQDQYNLGKEETDRERRKLQDQVDDLLEERNRLKAELKEAQDGGQDLRMQTLQNELNGQKQYTAELVKDLKKQKETAAEDMAKRIQALKTEAEQQAAEAYERGKETEAGRAGVLEKRLKDLEQELEAAEAREAKKARELAELRKEKTQARMDAARGIRADAMSGLDLAAAVRAFIGAAGTLPQMGQAISGMSESERDGIRAQVETVAEWVRASRAALGTVVAEASIM